MNVVMGTALLEIGSEGDTFPASTEATLYISGGSAFALALLLRFVLWPDPKDDFADAYNAYLREAMGLSDATQ